MINKEEVKNLVEIFYQPNFKTFFVNSLDGINFVKPVGVFVSLGMITSMKSIEDIRSVLGEKYNAMIAEISSRKIGSQFLNTLISTCPKQYYITDLDDTVLTEESAKAELARLHEQNTKEGSNLKVLMENAPKIARLQELIEKLDNENLWSTNLIQRTETGEYKLFHRYVNYKKEDEIEYRVGIYVCEKE